MVNHSFVFSSLIVVIGLILYLKIEYSSAFSVVEPPRLSLSSSAVVQWQTKQFSGRKSLQLQSTQEETVDEEAARLAAEVIAKTRSMSKLQNERGIEYAPWMNIKPEDAERIKGIMKEKAEARRKREEQEQTTRGALLRDSAFQELSGTGLKSKIVTNDEDGSVSVELEWATGSEANTKGFLVKRRVQQSNDPYEVIASYESFPPLASKGGSGGLYRYMDTTVQPGTNYFYRVTECDIDDDENDLSQCLVEIQTKEDATSQKIALFGFGIVAIGTLIASLALDPLQ